MQVDSTQASSLDAQKQLELHPELKVPATGDQQHLDQAEAAKATAKQQAVSASEDTAMLSEDLPDGSFAASKDASATTQTPKVSRISESELDALYASLESMKKELAQSRQRERQNAVTINSLRHIEQERDRYRAVSTLIDQGQKDRTTC